MKAIGPSFQLYIDNRVYKETVVNAPRSVFCQKCDTGFLSAYLSANGKQTLVVRIAFVE